jgi:hypothetical protein
VRAVLHQYYIESGCYLSVGSWWGYVLIQVWFETMFKNLKNILRVRGLNDTFLKL